VTQVKIIRVKVISVIINLEEGCSFGLGMLEYSFIHFLIFISVTVDILFISFLYMLSNM
jgi:hypothetical protein